MQRNTKTYYAELRRKLKEEASMPPEPKPTTGC